MNVSRLSTKGKKRKEKKMKYILSVIIKKGLKTIHKKYKNWKNITIEIVKGPEPDRCFDKVQYYCVCHHLNIEY